MNKTDSIAGNIKSDFFRYTGKQLSLFGFLKLYFYNETFHYLVYLRLSKVKNFLKFIVYFRLKLLQRKYSIVIPPSTVIGKGFYISHIGTIVVNPTTRFGRNCNISQGVTIGSNAGQAANIGDNVYIGPNSVIVENVRIGDNVTIGAGSIVVKDIPSNCTVAGVPARIINKDDVERRGRFIQNKVI